MAEETKNQAVIASRQIERRESQLWWLAVLTIFLLALTVLAVDTANQTSSWWLSTGIGLALNTKVVRISLVLSTLAIVAYFRDSARRLRNANKKLVMDLTDYSTQLERKNLEISKLRDLSDQLIGISVEVPSALDMILSMAVDVIGADTASVMLRLQGEDEMRIVSARGLPREVVESARVRVGESIAGLVAQDGKAVIINSDQIDGVLVERANRRDVIGSSIVAPIQIGEEIRGVINIAKKVGGYRFTEDDLEVVYTLANQASMVIQRCELLESLEGQVKALANALEELRRTQAELMHSEKLATIGQLASGVAHEINNPLQVILGRTQILRNIEKDESKLRSLNDIEVHTERIAEIVEGLLSVSRKDTGNMQEVNLNDVIIKALSLLESQFRLYDVIVTKELDPGLPNMIGNASQLQQVVTNLVLNGCQAMADSGGGRLTIHTRSNQGSIEMEVVDTGPGIDETIIGRIFEPFFTTKPEGKGNGLGLSIVLGIVQTHGGTVKAGNAPGGGACFTISLPAISHSLDGEIKAA